MVDFKDCIKALAERAAAVKEQVTTEEATKNALIMPFIKELGYDIFNPAEVVPEFTADVGLKKGEKVDYAILQKGKPVMLIECKMAGNTLNAANESQLIRYFNNTPAKFAILTNGIEYRFYTDLETVNIMDKKPFFGFNILTIDDAQIDEVKKFHKSYFDYDNICAAASDLKYMSELKSLISAELEKPSEGFVKFFAAQVYQGSFREKVREQFTVLVKKAFNQLIADMITGRLKSALDKETEEQNKQKEADEAAEAMREAKIVTTEEELDAFHIVRAIVAERVKSSRIAHRDNQSYFNILLDDNRNKTICRLYLGSTKKQIGIFDGDKNENKHEIKEIDDIYRYKKELLSIMDVYEGKK